MAHALKTIGQALCPARPGGHLKEGRYAIAEADDGLRFILIFEFTASAPGFGCRAWGGFGAGCIVPRTLRPRTGRALGPLTRRRDIFARGFDRGRAVALGATRPAFWPTPGCRRVAAL